MDGLAFWALLIIEAVLFGTWIVGAWMHDA